ncbi:MAG TPA: type III polyketide synthase [Anaerolineales bacterium]|jgi:predicted naringenin-chalcone synthase|nr:type III polyketide synthase [Anaerolineales bacterium]
MIIPSVLSIGTAVPLRKFSQTEIFDRFLAPFFGDKSVARSIFRNSGVGFRHTVIDGSYYSKDRGTQERNERYLDEALPLGETAIRRCLENAHISADEIDDFIVVSCTGVDTPGLDLQLAGRLRMRPDLRRTGILGMGCYAAFPALQRAREAVRSDPDRTVLVLAVELCSLHFQPEVRSIENVVSSALFADGAAAVLVRARNSSTGRADNDRPARPSLLDSATYCDYLTFDHMAFHLTNHGFEMHLSAYVPELLATNVGGLVDGLLQKHGLTRTQVRFWVVHPGSSKILDYVGSELDLAAGQLDCSRQVLYQYGNMSSATILFVLDEIQRVGTPISGDYGVLMAFGPGLTLESALVRW